MCVVLANTPNKMNYTMHMKEHEKLCQKLMSEVVRILVCGHLCLWKRVWVTWKLYLNHLTAGGGDPLKATVSLAGCPSMTVTGSKFLVNAGADESWACKCKFMKYSGSVFDRSCLSPSFWITRITTKLRCFFDKGSHVHKVALRSWGSGLFNSPLKVN